MEENQAKETAGDARAIPATPAAISSADISQLAAALSQFQGTVEQPKLNKDVTVKTKQGYAYRFRYADFSAVTKAAAPALKETGLSVTQIVTGGHLVTVLMHSSGQWLRSDLVIGNVQEYQELGSAITYLKRYSYCAMLGIVADADDDGNRNLGNSTADNTAPQPKGADAQPVPPEQLAQAKAELCAAKDREGYFAVFRKWQQANPKMCEKGSEFYAACAERGRQLKDAQCAPAPTKTA